MIEIGILGVLTADGSLRIYSLPVLMDQRPNSLINISPLSIVSIEKTQFTTFIWYPHNPCDKVLLGDVIGNIYLVKLDDLNGNTINSPIDAKKNFSILRIFHMAHTKEIKDLKWFPNSKPEEMIFSSCSEDGDIKVWDLNENFSPIASFTTYKVLKFYCALMRIICK